MNLHRTNLDQASPALRNGATPKQMADAAEMADAVINDMSTWFDVDGSAADCLKVEVNGRTVEVSLSQHGKGILSGIIVNALLSYAGHSSELEMVQ